MRTKWIALLLCGLLTLTSLAGCGSKEEAPAEDTQETVETDASTETEGETEEEADPFAEPMTFSLTGFNTSSTENHDNDFVNFYEEKFNVELEIMDNPLDGEAERFSLQATGDSLYDLNLWISFDFAGYYHYVDQGLFEPLPEDWAEKYPNLYDMVDKSGLLNELTVDGRVYAIPHSVYGCFLDVNPVTRHSAIYIRKDLAEQVGMGDIAADGTVKMSELRAFIEAVNEANLTEKKHISANSGMVQWIFSTVNGVPVTDFYDDGNGYAWTPNLPGYAGMLADAQEWYEAGLIDKDFYVKTEDDYKEEFLAGLSPVCLYQATVSNNAGDLALTFNSAVEGGNFDEDVILANPIAEDGTMYAQAAPNYWTASVFRPGIDAALMERILYMIDWACTPEGGTTAALGVQDIDWVYKEDGTIDVFEDTHMSEKYGNSWYVFFLFGYCPDDFGASGLAGEVTSHREKTQRLYSLRESGYVFMVPNRYNIYTGDSKTIYQGSVDLLSFVSQTITGGEDVEAALADYISANQGVWEPLLTEVNEYAGY